MARYFLLFFGLGFVASARAEYRAFELKIIAANGVASRTVESNFDELQYGMYYPLQPGEKIQRVTTWMCKGRTNEFERLCPRPLPPTASLSPNQSLESKP